MPRHNLFQSELCPSRIAYEQEAEPYRQVFAALYDFLGNYGGALDLKRSNFMCRADGTLVWNDVVFDSRTFTKHLH
jgi:hypothetical protein